MNNHPRQGPDAATYGFLAFALLFIWPIPFLIAAAIVAPFVWLFGIEPQSTLHWWAVGIVGCFVIAVFIAWRTD